MRVILETGKKTSYTESSQPSELRWVLLKKIDEETFESQAGVMKCRDYFNDMVFKYNDLETKLKVKFSPIYGFSIEKTKFIFGEGIYFLVFGIDDQESFFKSIDVLNKFLVEEQKLPAITFTKTEDVLIPPQTGFQNATKAQLKAGSWVLHIPHEYCLQTYRMSLLTQLIRMCTYGTALEKMEDFFDEKYFPSKTNSWGEEYHNLDWQRLNKMKQKVLNYWFYLPEEMADKIFYAAVDCNSIKINSLSFNSVYVHNNGFSSFLNYVK